ncbi:DegV family protein [Clostridium sediminicola]|uniref:DegV family protein n=1 Tax=Clostridium sediminicola TaxID=3114879 RepID=UPI0031F25A33
MEKIAIITCSTSGLDFIEGYDDIKLARTTIMLDNKEYLDGLNLSPKEFYERLDNLEEVPSTAQPSIGQLIDIYKELKGKGYTDAIYISISEHLSGTYQGVCLSNSYMDDFNVHAFDSKTASFLAGFMAIEAQRLVEEGKTVKEIIAHLEMLRDNDRIIFMVDDLKYLVKNGRLSNASGFFASVLKIKPLLEIKDNGKIVGVEKIRTTKKAIDRVIDSFLKDTKNGEETQFLFLFNTEAPKHIEYVKDRLKKVGIDTRKLIDAPISPAIGCHIGKGVIGIGYIKKF